MRGGAGRGQGPKFLPDNLKRIKLSGFRIQGWIITWLKEQPGSGGRLIEKALIEYYGLKNQGKSES